MARLWTQLAGGRGPGWQAGWTSDRALASRLGQWADVPRLEPKTREKCLALPLSPLNLLRRGTVVRFPPHVTTPGKVTTYCITSTQGNKPACALFVTENTKISALNIVPAWFCCFVQNILSFHHVQLQGVTTATPDHYDSINAKKSIHCELHHLHGLHQTVMTWNCLRHNCSDYHIGDGSSLPKTRLTTSLT